MNVRCDKQFGFRKNHSTTHAVNYSVNHLLNEIESRHHVVGMFIDLSKAFDTIDHKKMMVKLNHYGIRGMCHDQGCRGTLKNLKNGNFGQKTLKKT